MFYTIISVTTSRCSTQSVMENWNQDAGWLTRQEVHRIWSSPPCLTTQRVYRVHHPHPAWQHRECTEYIIPTLPDNTESVQSTTIPTLPDNTESVQRPPSPPCLTTQRVYRVPPSPPCLTMQRVYRIPSSLPFSAWQHRVYRIQSCQPFIRIKCSKIRFYAQ